MPTKLPTPEQTRDRLLGAITKILEDPFVAPEIRTAHARTKLYALMCAEFNAFAAFHGDVIARVNKELGLPVGTGAEAILARVAYLSRRVRRTR